MIHALKSNSSRRFQKAEVVIRSCGMLCATHAADEAVRLAFSRKRSSFFVSMATETNKQTNTLILPVRIQKSCLSVITHFPVQCNDFYLGEIFLLQIAKKKKVECEITGSLCGIDSQSQKSGRGLFNFVKFQSHDKFYNRQILFFLCVTSDSGRTYNDFCLHRFILYYPSLI